MIFSVFDDHARVFDYYEGPGTSADYGSRGTKYRALNGAPSGPPPGLGGGGNLGPIGFVAESLCIPLPANVRAVGRGKEARGVCAVRARDSGMGDYVTVSNLGDYASLDNLAGLGEDAPITTPKTGVSFGQVVTASVIATVVGVFVQRALKPTKRRKKR